MALPSCFSALADAASDLAPLDFLLLLPPFALLDFASCFSAFAPSALAAFDFDLGSALPPLLFESPPFALADLVDGVAKGSVWKGGGGESFTVSFKTGKASPSCSSVSFSFSTGSLKIRGSSLRTGSFKSLSMPVRPWASSFKLVPFKKK